MKGKKFQQADAKPFIIEGGIFVDDRGEIAFVNGFNMKMVKRFYTVSNHRRGFIRAWHAHKKESKYVSVVKGVAIVAAVKIDNWANPSKDSYVYRYVLSEKKPSILFIPQGFANGFMTLTEDTKLIFFSTATLEESRKDDIRFEAYYWNPWKVVER